MEGGAWGGSVGGTGGLKVLWLSSMRGRGLRRGRGPLARRSSLHCHAFICVLLQLLQSLQRAQGVRPGSACPTHAGEPGGAGHKWQQWGGGSDAAAGGCCVSQRIEKTVSDRYCLRYLLPKQCCCALVCSQLPEPRQEAPCLAQGCHTHPAITEGSGPPCSGRRQQCVP